MKDRDVLFHEKWLGLAQPIEGLVFSVPVLADAQIAPELRTELSVEFAEQLDDGEVPRIASAERFFRDFLGYSQPGMIVPRSELPAELSFYAAEGGQELRPSFALGRGPFASDDPFAVFDRSAPKTAAPGPDAAAAERWFALLWDLTETGHDLDLDAAESTTGPWRYPPTAKLERLLRHVGIPVGLLFNGRELRLVYAPSGESTAHLTFRVEHLRRPDGRPLLAALDLLLHARRAYSASPQHTLEGLLAESRRRQADVTDELAKQVFEAVEILVAGFETAAARDCREDRIDWLRAALEEEGDHFYQGVLSVVLRLVFLLYAEDQGLLPVEHETYSEHLSLFGLHQRLSHDAGAHPESMHHRFGAYGRLLSLFRSVFFGVKHGSLDLPPRRGRLFDPNAFPFLEGGLPGWTAAVADAEARAAAVPPSIDDGTVYRVMHRLVVFEGQRLSYRTLDVEQIGSVYESLMGYHVLRLGSAAVRIGKHGVWVESDAARSMSPTDRARFFKETCGLNPGPIKTLETAIKAASDESAVVEALSEQAVGRRADILRHRAPIGRLVLQPGEERRRTASHYTPRSLTEKVVKRTLEPLLACLGENRTPDQILQLKICDPAMGSGAFLVATCRELAGEIVAAWTRQGELARVIEEHGDAHLHARRLVAQKCLYGVDKNAAAVELAKLSLWLVTLSKTLPFTFVDHALRHGDSLVGLDFKQIAAFHWSPPGQVDTCAILLREALDQAVELRQQILELADHEDPVAQGEKRRLFEFSQQAIDRVRLVADVCVGAFFAETKDAARERERKRRLGLIESWLTHERARGDEKRSEELRVADAATARKARDELQELAVEARRVLSPFHWWIEFPEVFFEERPDPLQRGAVSGVALMEGVVGNPPFLGGTGITAAFGSPVYVHWLKLCAPEAATTTDLCAYFLRRAAILIGEHGTVGFVVTNSISESDTRAAGLQALIKEGGRIVDATTNIVWPGAAAVHVSLVVLAFGIVGRHPKLKVFLDECDAAFVNSRLEPKPERPDPARLLAQAGSCFVGTDLGSNGFVLDPAEAAELLAREPAAKALVRPLIGGREVNTSPDGSHDRFVINFGSAPLSHAENFPNALGIVRARVKPERDKARDHGPGNHGKKYWWQHTLRRDPLYESIAQLRRCLVTSEVAKHLCLSFQPTDRVFTKQLFVFPFDGHTQFAVLQSRVHTFWARLLSSSMKTDLRYAATDCFETLPFPQSDPRTVIPELEAAGHALCEARAEYMVDTQQGLTKTYNALKDPGCTDPRILALRRLHEAMDRVVLDAYGWKDLVVPPYCPATETEQHAERAFEDHVIDRLYALNAERAAEEKRLGLSAKKSALGQNRDGDADDTQPFAPRAKKKRGKKTTKDQRKLFE